MGYMEILYLLFLHFLSELGVMLNYLIYFQNEGQKGLALNPRKMLKIYFSYTEYIL